MQNNIIKLLGAWKIAYVIKGPPKLAPVVGNDSSFSGSWVGMREKLNSAHWMCYILIEDCLWACSDRHGFIVRRMSQDTARQTSATYALITYANIPQLTLERAQTQAPIGGRALQEEKDEVAVASFLSSAGESELFLLFNLLRGVRSANRGKLFVGRE